MEMKKRVKMYSPDSRKPQYFATREEALDMAWTELELSGCLGRGLRIEDWIISEPEPGVWRPLPGATG